MYYLGVSYSMAVENKNILFKKLESKDAIPFDLLLLADPSIDLIAEYLKVSELFVATDGQEILGVIVLFPLTGETIEIKNIAVRTKLQRQGIGSILINNAIRLASQSKIKNIFIGTADTSIAQLSLYQKLGFRISGIKEDFFLTNYDRPIYENGIQAKHMVTLIKTL